MSSDRLETPTKAQPQSDSRAVKAAAREKRLKVALRANLKRRKAQARSRDDQGNKDH